MNDLQKLAQEELAAFINDDLDLCDHYKNVTGETIKGKGRWSVCYEQVFRDERDGSYWKLIWSRGSTEYQDQGPEDIVVIAVKPKEVIIIEYVPLKE